MEHHVLCPASWSYPRDEHCVLRACRSECQLALFAGFSQPLIGDRHDTPGHCPSAGHCDINSGDLPSLGFGSLPSFLARNEYCVARIYRSECHLAPPPGVPQPLNSDRQSTRGQCPNTGRFAHLATGESISQPLISDCQFTPGHCPSAGHCVILTVRILSRPNGFRLNQFMDV